MFSKVELYNVALSTLLLERQLVDVTTDNSNEKKVLDLYYDAALFSTLEDMDLDSTTTKVTLALVTAAPVSPYDELWNYVYTYPANCLFFRRIYSGAYKDNRYTHEPKNVEMYDGSKAILTNKVGAIAEIIPKDIDVTSLSSLAGMAIATRLAYLSTPLIVGKGAAKLKADILTQYTFYKAEAQAHDQMENFSYHEDAVESEFVAERTS